MELNQRDLQKNSHISLKTFLLIELTRVVTFTRNLLFDFCKKTRSKIRTERRRRGYLQLSALFNFVTMRAIKHFRDMIKNTHFVF